MRDRTATDSNSRALVVEDDAVTREFLVEALERSGWHVEAAANLTAALGSIRACMPRLVLCDVGLPDGDAFEFALQLTLDMRAEARALYAIALSAEIGPSLRARLIAAGYDDVLAKPLSLSQLTAALPDAGNGTGSAAHGVRHLIPGQVAGLQPALRDGAAILDDVAALEVCGDWHTVQTLRELLADELPGDLQRLREADEKGDALAASEILHRLRSAGGFCGAAALIRAVSEAGLENLEAATRDRRLADVLRAGHALLGHLSLRRTQQQLGGA